MPRIFSQEEFKWVEGRFGLHYDLVYVDPLLCDPRLHALWFRWPPAELGRRMDRQAFVRRMAIQMRARPQDSIPSSFLQPGGAGMRFKADRQIQARTQREVDLHWHLVAHRQYASVEYFNTQREALRPWANQPGADSLVVIDAALGKITHVPKSIQLTYQQPALFYTPTLRSVECILADCPAPLLRLHHGAIPLMVDQNAFYNWTEDFYTILSAGWYPFARVVGLYGANAAGRPFVDVLAILIKAYPSLDHLLRPRPGEDECWSAAGTLRRMKQTALDPALADLKARTDNTGMYAYEHDEKFLAPLLLFRLACQLHHVNYQGLSLGAPEDYQAFADYMEALHKIAEQLARLDIRSRIRMVPGGLSPILPADNHPPAPAN